MGISGWRNCSIRTIIFHVWTSLFRVQTHSLAQNHSKNYSLKAVLFNIQSWSISVSWLSYVTCHPHIGYTVTTKKVTVTVTSECLLETIWISLGADFWRYVIYWDVNTWCQKLQCLWLIRSIYRKSYLCDSLGPM